MHIRGKDRRKSRLYHVRYRSSAHLQARAGMVKSGHKTETGERMKILHTSDWHLGMSVQNHSLEEDQRFFLRQIVSIAEREQVGALLLAGDVFDRPVPSAAALRLYDETVTELCDRLHIPMLVIAGNHDNAPRLAACRSLLKKAGLIVAGELTRTPERVSLDGADVWLLPWFTTEKARAVFPERAEEIDSMESAFRVVLDCIRAQFVPGRRKLLLAHAFLVDAETSLSDRAAEVGRAAAVGRGVFEGFDYVALGHLHGPQDIGPTLRYSGTPMIYSFGREERQVKSVTLLDTETLTRSVVPLPALHARSSIEGPYDRVLAAEGLSDLQRRGYVRVRITDRYVGLEAASALLETYPLLLELSGQAYDREDAGVRLTPEELEREMDDPEAIFRRFCQDCVGLEPDGHLLALFREAQDDYDRSVQA